MFTGDLMFKREYYVNMNCRIKGGIHMKFYNKIALSIVVVMSLGTASSVVVSKESVKVYASSTQLSDAKARVDHLSKSLHTNYLGIKNQGQWQEYIKELREVISTIPLEEEDEANNLIEFVNKAEALVQGLSRINQVEKSIETNYVGIKNVRQWGQYITLAEYDLSKVDKTEFLNEYEELVGRMEKCQRVIEGVEADFEREFSNALNLYYKAEASREVDDANIAYDEAKKLGTCAESDYLENECKMLLVRIGEIKISDDEKILQDEYRKLDIYIQDKGISIDGSGAENVKKEIKKIVSNSIEVEVRMTFKNLSNNEETYEVILSKGKEKMHPIVLIFS